MVNGRPGVAPQTAKREKFTRLIAEGLSIAEAARRVGIHYRTGRRWLRGRTVRLPSGVARQYAPVIIVEAPVSARFLSEDERVTIAPTSPGTSLGHAARHVQYASNRPRVATMIGIRPAVRGSVLTRR